MASWFRELLDGVGTKLNLPEMGLSEKGGIPTKNTGRKQFSNVSQYGIGTTNAPSDFGKALAKKEQGGSMATWGKGVGSTQNELGSPTALAAQSNGFGGGGGGYETTVAAAQKKAQDNARKAQLKGEGLSTLDQLYALYDQLISEIQRVGADQSGRVNKDFDGKVQGQVDDMNNGMYDVDVSSAAGNLADSSFRSFDRGKVRTAADSNIKTLNSARESSLGEIGSMVNNDTAKYQADKAGIGRTRNLLNSSDDLNEIQSTANTLDATKRGVQADKAKYSTTGEFAAKAAKIGQYDTSALENTLSSVIANASASPATKAATINDLLAGTPLDDEKKAALKNKYTQNV